MGLGQCSRLHGIKGAARRNSLDSLARSAPGVLARLHALIDTCPTSLRITDYTVYLHGNMADVPHVVKIGISLKMLPNKSAVYFKSDGARFGQTRTIKLLTGSKYSIEVVVKPGAVEATYVALRYLLQVWIVLTWLGIAVVIPNIGTRAVYLNRAPGNAQFLYL